jgi:DNA modification methylase
MDKEEIMPTDEEPIKVICGDCFEIIKKIPNNSIVLDCFLGSGTTAVVCKQLGRKYIGIEITEEYCKIARKRLAQDVLKP